MKGMPGGMQQFIKQANQMQQRVQKLQEDLAKREYQATAGGSAIQVTVTGEYKISSISISQEVVKAGDTEMLQDLVMTAVNDAIGKAKSTSEEEMGKVTGGLSMPGLF